jgi:hypothetical protein
MHKSSRAAYYLVALILGLGLILKLLSAAPTWMHSDENYYLNIGHNYIERGELTPYMWRLDTDTNIIAGSGTGYGIYLLVGWMKLVGVSLFGGRLLMIFIGLLTSGVMYAVAYKWWESRAAGVVALVFGLISTSPFYSYVIRMDAPGMLVYSLVLLLHIHAVRSRSRWLHFATGVALVISVEFHVLGTLYILALTVWNGIEYLQEIRSKRRLVLNTGPVYFALGGLIAGVIYILVHIAPDSAAYFSIPSAYYAPLELSRELARYVRFMVKRPLELLLLAGGVLAAVRRGRREDFHFVVLLVTWMVGLYIAGIGPFTHYTAHIWPLLAIGTAGLIARGLKSQGEPTPARLYFGLALAVVTLVFNSMLFTGQFQPFEFSYPVNTLPVYTYVRENVPTETVIMGDVRDYYNLLEYPDFLSYRDTHEFGEAAQGETHLEFWQRVQPLVILGHYRADDPELDQYMREMEFEQVETDVWIAARLRDELGGA